MESSCGPITELLSQAGAGDELARGRLWSAVYDELRGLARAQLANERGGHVLQPTALVHEAYFRLVGGDGIQFNGRGHFFSAAARAMRQIRVDDARNRQRLKRGGGRGAQRLDEPVAVFDDDPTTVIAIDEALERLHALDPRKGELVTLRYFAGLTEEETAAALGVSRRTVQQDWKLARAWLHRELSKGDTRAG
jgi:RNA polymerase sigma factor (TIGR02999 family)